MGAHGHVCVHVCVRMCTCTYVCVHVQAGLWQSRIPVKSNWPLEPGNQGWEYGFAQHWPRTGALLSPAGFCPPSHPAMGEGIRAGRPGGKQEVPMSETAAVLTGAQRAPKVVRHQCSNPGQKPRSGVVTRAGDSGWGSGQGREDCGFPGGLLHDPAQRELAGGHPWPSVPTLLLPGLPLAEPHRTQRTRAPVGVALPGQGRAGATGPQERADLEGGTEVLGREGVLLWFPHPVHDGGARPLVQR